MDLELAGRVILVTGGSEGLGAALVRTLAAEGARVAFCARRAEALDQLADEIMKAGAAEADVLPVAADVTSPADLERFTELAVGRWGRIDGLVNNAGRSAAEMFDTQTDEMWSEDLELKVYGAIRLIRLALPHLRAAGGGSIVNTLAVAAKAPGAGSTPTSVSRAAGLALTKALSKELGRDGIRVNAVLIGLLESRQWERRATELGVSTSDLYADLGQNSGIPLGRVGEARDFADLAAFLLSPRAAYLTGAGINLDGGLSPVH
ncbi:NAD(P)-dependent dehydrogenase, short-chain alcohol dehydrogenase family [Parafrankia irregularis]|uniref:NAD(P)-dependent dehydrogenase, short-chain alcohol dehydrogenase family n=1 Tax=Parafrankia irregularis TaxID=795642 RepID=A0A0S4QN75_9ACTN|nr:MULTISPECIES: SDR family oxidoreductase [Parafrankia]MBE3202146.1 SDR family oxidoreductase [Parafrankia sp. CH37]CUU55930.1 NAD(P)-dependent dehydrogenase, short-chain alcohol dehydrogenase family [Parafrankia irregularis]